MNKVANGVICIHENVVICIHGNGVICIHGNVVICIHVNVVICIHKRTLYEKKIRDILLFEIKTINTLMKKKE